MRQQRGPGTGRNAEQRACAVTILLHRRMGNCDAVAELSWKMLVLQPLDGDLIRWVRNVAKICRPQ